MLNSLVGLLQRMLKRCFHCRQQGLFFRSSFDPMSQRNIRKELYSMLDIIHIDLKQMSMGTHISYESKRWSCIRLQGAAYWKLFNWKNPMVKKNYTHTAHAKLYFRSIEKKACKKEPNTHTKLNCRRKSDYGRQRKKKGDSEKD